MPHDSPKIIFFGTPQFAVVIFKKLIEAGLAPIAIVTAPDKPAGRGYKLKSPPLKLLAEEYHIPVLQPDKLKDDSFLETLRAYAADVFVIAAYGKILPVSLLNIPPKGTINVHPSLLPWHRGPSPIQGAILEEDESTGVTLMLTDEKMDHGPILTQSTYHIVRITYQELHDALANMGGEMLVNTLPKWVAGEITPREQDHTSATYTKLLTKEDGHIDWNKSAKEIDRMVRALNPWPGTWSYLSVIPGLTRNPENHTEWIPHPACHRYAQALAGRQVRDDKLKRIKILAGKPTDETSAVPPGTLTKTKSGALAACTGDFLYIIDLLQMEGKPTLPGTSISIGRLNGILV